MGEGVDFWAREVEENFEKISVFEVLQEDLVRQGIAVVIFRGDLRFHPLGKFGEDDCHLRGEILEHMRLDAQSEPEDFELLREARAVLRVEKRVDFERLRHCKLE